MGPHGGGSPPRGRIDAKSHDGSYRGHHKGDGGEDCKGLRLLEWPSEGSTAQVRGKRWDVQSLDRILTWMRQVAFAWRAAEGCLGCTHCPDSITCFVLVQSQDAHSQACRSLSGTIHIPSGINHSGTRLEIPSPSSAASKHSVRPCSQCYSDP